MLTVEQLRKISGDIGILEISIENIFENPKLQEHMEQFFKCANELGIRLSLSFVVDSKSRKYLYDAIELCHKYEANLTTRIVALVGRAVENSKNDSILEEQNTLRVQYDIISYLLKRRYFEDILVGAYIGNLQAKKCCGAFGNILAIHPDGSTLMCGNFKHKKYSMGNIKTKSMEEICKDLDEKLSDVAYEAEFFVDKQKMCSGCDVRYFCSGPCAAEKAENDLKNMQKKCFSTKIMLRYAMFYYDTKRSVEENLKVYQKYLEGFLKDA